MHRARTYCTHRIVHVRFMSHRTYCTCIARHRIASVSDRMRIHHVRDRRSTARHYASHASHVLHCTNAPHVLHCSTLSRTVPLPHVPYRIVLHVSHRTYELHVARIASNCSTHRTYALHVRTVVRTYHARTHCYPQYSSHCIALHAWRIKRLVCNIMDSYG
jgi:hypothetical protein